MFHKEDWFPLEVYSETSMISFAMHSPTSFPQQMNVKNFLKLKAGKKYEMTYNRLKTILLEPPYKTNCKKYHLDDNHGFQTRSDCVNVCIQEDLKQICSEYLGNNSKKLDYLTNCYFRSDSLKRKDNSIDSTSLRLCPIFSVKHKNISNEMIRNIDDIRSCIEHNIRHLNSECEKSCKPNCESRFYNYNIKTNIKVGLREFHAKEDRLTTITIAHNQLPDQITEHIPEITFTQFTANFGGLLGMWTGLSFMAVFQFLLKIID